MIQFFYSVSVILLVVYIVSVSGMVAHIKTPKMVHTLMESKMALYVLVGLSVVNVLGYMMNNCIRAVIIFALVGTVAYGFTKNMVVVLSACLLFTTMFAACGGASGGGPAPHNAHHYVEGFVEGNNPSGSTSSAADITTEAGCTNSTNNGTWANGSCTLPLTEKECTNSVGNWADGKCALMDEAQCANKSGTWDKATSKCSLPLITKKDGMTGLDEAKCTEDWKGVWDKDTNNCTLTEAQCTSNSGTWANGDCTAPAPSNMTEEKCTDNKGTWDKATSKCSEGEGMTTVYKKNNRVDYAATVEDAYDDLNKILGGAGMKNLSNDTQNLVKHQQDLTKAMQSMGPLVEQATNMMGQMGGKGGIGSMLEKFSKGLPN